jgi:hypothetical protein
MTAEARQPQARPPPDVDARLETLAAENAVLKDSVARLELMFGKVCERLGVDRPPPMIDATWTTIKGAAADAGFSESYIRKLMKAGKIEVARRGGRILVRKATVPQSGAIKRLA